jgi:hypothetical protein
VNLSVRSLVTDSIRNFGCRGTGFFAGNAHTHVSMPSHYFHHKYLQRNVNVEFFRPDDSVLLRHDAASINDRLLAFRGEVLPPNTRVVRS